MRSETGLGIVLSAASGEELLDVLGKPMALVPGELERCPRNGGDRTVVETALAHAVEAMVGE